MGEEIFGRTLLVAGGEIVLDFVKKYLKTEQFQTVIGVDAGLNALERLHIVPDYALGDFDSVSGEAAKVYENEHTKVFSFPPEKDATDLELGINLAIRGEAEEIVILGATGRRLDHFIANVHLLFSSVQTGIPMYLVDSHNRISLLKEKREFRRDELFGSYISFLPFTDEVRGLTLKGFAYEVEDFLLKKGSSIGVSNEPAKGTETMIAKAKEGILIVVESRD